MDFSGYRISIESDDIVSDPLNDEDDFDQSPSVADLSDSPAQSSSPAAEDSDYSEDEEGYGHYHQEIVYDEGPLDSDEDQEDDEDQQNSDDQEDEEDQEHGFSDSDSDIMSIHSGRDAASEAPSDDDDELFVNQGQRLPPLAEVIPEMRRTIARTMEAVQEMQSAVRRSAREHHRNNARHHPYNRNGNRARDELVAVEMQGRGGMRGNRAPAPAQAEVIDLTGEPDSPAEPREPRVAAPRARNRNPRRQASVNQRTPSLARGDGNNATVIDLTMDDPPSPPPLPLPLPRRHHNNHHRQPANPHRRNPQINHIDLEREERVGALDLFQVFNHFARPGLGLIRNVRGAFGRAPAEVEVQIIGGGAVHMADPLAHNLPNLNYGNGGGDRAPKPAHVAPPPAREGYTRDTENGEDDILVCPGCEEELQYDPDADNIPAAKKARTRKDQEEHHYWALKDCGHVYCGECYERRRSVAKNSPVNFRKGGDNGKKVFCAVNSCLTEVIPKGNWVGLFL